ncbi:hypothetical protein, partial [Micromonospora sp. NPDC003776]
GPAQAAPRSPPAPGREHDQHTHHRPPATRSRTRRGISLPRPCLPTQVGNDPGNPLRLRIPKRIRDAQKIALLLTTQTEKKLKEEIEKLTAAHKEQIEGLKRSGTRSAWVTFVLGAVVGFVLNIVSSLIVR